MPQRMTTAAMAEIVEGNAQALVYLTVTLGGVITASSRNRWTAAAWHDALRVPHAPLTWGAVLLAAGLMLLGAQWLDSHDREHRLLLRTGYGIACVWSTSLAATQFAAFIHDTSGTANAVGLIVWCYLAYLYHLRFSKTARRHYA